MKHGKHPVFVSIIQPCVAACMHARVWFAWPRYFPHCFWMEALEPACPELMRCRDKAAQLGQ